MEDSVVVRKLLNLFVMKVSSSFAQIATVSLFEQMHKKQHFKVAIWKIFADIYYHVHGYSELSILCSDYLHFI